MLIQKESMNCTSTIKSYKPGCIKISDNEFHTPVIISPEAVKSLETIGEFKQLKAETLLSIINSDTEVLLIGSGEKHQFLPQTEINKLQQQGIGIEVMGTRQACHTFQVLALEQRQVMALLFP